MSTFDPKNAAETKIPYEETAQPFLIGFTVGLITNLLGKHFKFGIQLYVRLLKHLFTYKLLQVVRPEIDLHEA